MRLFAALPLAEAAVERLFALQLRWSRAQDGLRWSAPQQWHITLHFFGEVSDEQASCLDRALAGLSAATCAITIDSLGTFPAKGILYAAGPPTAGLTALQAEVVERGTECGIPGPSRAFMPHVTMARSKGRAGTRNLAQLQTSSSLTFGPPSHWTATACLLIKSTLRPSGAEYTVINRYPLKPS